MLLDRIERLTRPLSFLLAFTFLTTQATPLASAAEYLRQAGTDRIGALEGALQGDPTWHWGAGGKGMEAYGPHNLLGLGQQHRLEAEAEARLFSIAGPGARPIKEMVEAYAEDYRRRRGNSDAFDAEDQYALNERLEQVESGLKRLAEPVMVSIDGKSFRWLDRFRIDLILDETGTSPLRAQGLRNNPLHQGLLLDALDVKQTQGLYVIRRDLDQVEALLSAGRDGERELLRLLLHDTDDILEGRHTESLKTDEDHADAVIVRLMLARSETQADAWERLQAQRGEVVGQAAADLKTGERTLTHRVTKLPSGATPADAAAAIQRHLEASGAFASVTAQPDGQAVVITVGFRGPPNDPRIHTHLARLTDEALRQLTPPPPPARLAVERIQNNTRLRVTREGRAEEVDLGAASIEEPVVVGDAYGVAFTPKDEPHQRLVTAQLVGETEPHLVNVMTNWLVPITDYPVVEDTRLLISPDGRLAITFLHMRRHELHMTFDREGYPMAGPGEKVEGYYWLGIVREAVSQETKVLDVFPGFGIWSNETPITVHEFAWVPNTHEVEMRYSSAEAPTVVHVRRIAAISPGFQKTVEARLAAFGATEKEARFQFVHEQLTSPYPSLASELEKHRALMGETDPEKIRQALSTMEWLPGVRPLFYWAFELSPWRDSSNPEAGQTFGGPTTGQMAFGADPVTAIQRQTAEQSSRWAALLEKAIDVKAPSEAAKILFENQVVSREHVLRLIQLIRSPPASVVIRYVPSDDYFHAGPDGRTASTFTFHREDDGITTLYVRDLAGLIHQALEYVIFPQDASVPQAQRHTRAFFAEAIAAGERYRGVKPSVVVPTRALDEIRSKSREELASLLTTGPGHQRAMWDELRAIPEDHPEAAYARAVADVLFTEARLRQSIHARDIEEAREAERIKAGKKPSQGRALGQARALVTSIEADVARLREGTSAELDREAEVLRRAAEALRQLTPPSPSAVASTVQEQLAPRATAAGGEELIAQLEQLAQQREEVAADWLIFRNRRDEETGVARTVFEQAMRKRADRLISLLQQESTLLRQARERNIVARTEVEAKEPLDFVPYDRLHDEEARLLAQARANEKVAGLLIEEDPSLVERLGAKLMGAKADEELMAAPDWASPTPLRVPSPPSALLTSDNVTQRLDRVAAHLQGVINAAATDGLITPDQAARLRKDVEARQQEFRQQLEHAAEGRQPFEVPWVFRGIWKDIEDYLVEVSGRIQENEARRKAANTLRRAIERWQQEERLSDATIMERVQLIGFFDEEPLPVDPEILKQPPSPEMLTRLALTIEADPGQWSAIHIEHHPDDDAFTVTRLTELYSVRSPRTPEVTVERGKAYAWQRLRVRWSIGREQVVATAPRIAHATSDDGTLVAALYQESDDPNARWFLRVARLGKAPSDVFLPERWQSMDVPVGMAGATLTFTPNSHRLQIHPRRGWFSLRAPKPLMVNLDRRKYQIDISALRHRLQQPNSHLYPASPITAYHSLSAADRRRLLDLDWSAYGEPQLANVLEVLARIRRQEMGDEEAEITAVQQALGLSKNKAAREVAASFVRFAQTYPSNAHEQVAVKLGRIDWLLRSMDDLSGSFGGFGLTFEELQEVRHILLRAGVDLSSKEARQALAKFEIDRVKYLVDRAMSVSTPDVTADFLAEYFGEVAARLVHQAASTPDQIGRPAPTNQLVLEYEQRLMALQAAEKDLATEQGKQEVTLAAAANRQRHLADLAAGKTGPLPAGQSPEDIQRDLDTLTLTQNVLRTKVEGLTKRREDIQRDIMVLEAALKALRRGGPGAAIRGDVALMETLLRYAEAFYRLVKGRAAAKAATPRELVEFYLDHIKSPPAGVDVQGAMVTPVDPAVLRAAFDSLPQTLVLPDDAIEVVLVDLPLDRHAARFTRVVVNPEDGIPAINFGRRDGRWVIAIAASFWDAHPEQRQAILRHEIREIRWREDERVQKEARELDVDEWIIAHNAAVQEARAARKEDELAIARVIDVHAAPAAWHPGAETVGAADKAMPLPEADETYLRGLLLEAEIGTHDPVYNGALEVLAEVLRGPKTEERRLQAIDAFIDLGLEYHVRLVNTVFRHKGEAPAAPAARTLTNPRPSPEPASIEKEIQVALEHHILPLLKAERGMSLDKWRKYLTEAQTTQFNVVAQILEQHMPTLRPYIGQLREHIGSYQKGIKAIAALPATEISDKEKHLLERLFVANREGAGSQPEIDQLIERFKVPPAQREAARALLAQIQFGDVSALSEQTLPTQLSAVGITREQDPAVFDALLAQLASRKVATLVGSTGREPGLHASPVAKPSSAPLALDALGQVGETLKRLDGLRNEHGKEFWCEITPALSKRQFDQTYPAAADRGFVVIANVSLQRLFVHRHDQVDPHTVRERLPAAINQALQDATGAGVSSADAQRLQEALTLTTPAPELPTEDALRLAEINFDVALEEGLDAQQNEINRSLPQRSGTIPASERITNVVIERALGIGPYRAVAVFEDGHMKLLVDGADKIDDYIISEDGRAVAVRYRPHGSRWDRLKVLLAGEEEPVDVITSRWIIPALSADGTVFAAFYETHHRGLWNVRLKVAGQPAMDRFAPSERPAVPARLMTPARVQFIGATHTVKVSYRLRLARRLGDSGPIIIDVDALQPPAPLVERLSVGSVKEGLFSQFPPLYTGLDHAVQEHLRAIIPSQGYADFQVAQALETLTSVYRKDELEIRQANGALRRILGVSRRAARAYVQQAIAIFDTPGVREAAMTLAVIDEGIRIIEASNQPVSQHIMAHSARLRAGLMRADPGLTREQRVARLVALGIPHFGQRAAEAFVQYVAKKLADTMGRAALRGGMGTQEENAAQARQEAEDELAAAQAKLEKLEAQLRRQRAAGATPTPAAKTPMNRKLSVARQRVAAARKALARLGGVQLSESFVHELAGSFAKIRATTITDTVKAVAVGKDGVRIAVTLTDTLREGNDQEIRDWVEWIVNEAQADGVPAFAAFDNKTAACELVGLSADQVRQVLDAVGPRRTHGFYGLRFGDTLRIGKNVTVSFVKASGIFASLRFEAPPDVAVRKVGGLWQSDSVLGYGAFDVAFVRFGEMLRVGDVVFRLDNALGWRLEIWAPKAVPIARVQVAPVAGGMGTPEEDAARINESHDRIGRLANEPVGGIGAAEAQHALEAVQALSDQLQAAGAMSPHETRPVTVERLMRLGANEARARQVVEELQGGALKLKGELLDVVHLVDGNEQVVDSLDRNIVHRAGLTHRTANAVIVAPDGRIILQQRPHNKVFPLNLSIYGGHVAHGESYRHTIEKELKEELGLEAMDPLQGDLHVVGTEGGFSYVDPAGDNSERRALYVYRLSEQEWKRVLAEQANLDQEKVRRTRPTFEAWLEEQQQQKSGYGEVWNVHVVSLNELRTAARDGQGPHLTVTNTFADGAVTEPAYFTADVLQPLVEDRALMNQVEALLALAGEPLPEFLQPLQGHTIQDTTGATYTLHIEPLLPEWRFSAAHPTPGSEVIVTLDPSTRQVKITALDGVTPYWFSRFLVQELDRQLPTLRAQDRRMLLTKTVPAAPAGDVATTDEAVQQRQQVFHELFTTFLATHEAHRSRFEMAGVRELFEQVFNGRVSSRDEFFQRLGQLLGELTSEERQAVEGFLQRIASWLHRGGMGTPEEATARARQEAEAELAAARAKLKELQAHLSRQQAEHAGPSAQMLTERKIAVAEAEIEVAREALDELGGVRLSEAFFEKHLPDLLAMIRSRTTTYSTTDSLEARPLGGGGVRITTPKTLRGDDDHWIESWISRIVDHAQAAGVKAVSVFDNEKAACELNDLPADQVERVLATVGPPRIHTPYDLRFGDTLRIGENVTVSFAGGEVTYARLMFKAPDEVTVRKALPIWNEEPVLGRGTFKASVWIGEVLRVGDVALRLNNARGWQLDIWAPKAVPIERVQAKGGGPEISYIAPGLGSEASAVGTYPSGPVSSTESAAERGERLAREAAAFRRLTGELPGGEVAFVDDGSPKPPATDDDAQVRAATTPSRYQELQPLRELFAKQLAGRALSVSILPSTLLSPAVAAQWHKVTLEGGQVEIQVDAAPGKNFNEIVQALLQQEDTNPPRFQLSAEDGALWRLVLAQVAAELGVSIPLPALDADHAARLAEVDALRAAQPVRRIVAGNWKGNLVSPLDDYLRTLLQKLRDQQVNNVDVIIYVPLAVVREAMRTVELFAPGLSANGIRLRIGVQDVSAVTQAEMEARKGAYTGETTARMLKQLRVAHVLLGHSERRTVVDDATGRRLRVTGRGEDHATVLQKIRNARAEGLEVTLAIGETFDERVAGRTFDVLAEHLAEEYAPLTPQERGEGFTIAYEPVWAIGRGATAATNEQAEEAHRFIMAELAARGSVEEAAATPLLYGGNVKPDNTAGLLVQPHIGGVLVGGASLNAEDFAAIAVAAQRAQASPREVQEKAKEVFAVWRRSYDIAPPPDETGFSESLKDTRKRNAPAFLGEVMPRVVRDRADVWTSTHGNVLRGNAMDLFGVTEEEVAGFTFPLATPVHVQFNLDGSVHAVYLIETDRNPDPANVQATETLLTKKGTEKNFIVKRIPPGSAPDAIAARPAGTGSLTLIRHGQTITSDTLPGGGRFAGWTDVPLTPQGHEEAQAAGRALRALDIPVDMAFTSDLQRAYNTLEDVAAAYGVPVSYEYEDAHTTRLQALLPATKDPRLKERHYGALTGRPRKEFMEELASRIADLWAKEPTLRTADARTIAQRLSATWNTPADSTGKSSHLEIIDALGIETEHMESLRQGMWVEGMPEIFDYTISPFVAKQAVNLKNPHWVVIHLSSTYLRGVDAPIAHERLIEQIDTATGGIHSGLPAVLIADQASNMAEADAIAEALEKAIPASSSQTTHLAQRRHVRVLPGNVDADQLIGLLQAEHPDSRIGAIVAEPQWAQRLHRELEADQRDVPIISVKPDSSGGIAIIAGYEAAARYALERSGVDAGLLAGLGVLQEAGHLIPKPLDANVRKRREYETYTTSVNEAVEAI